MKSFPRLHSLHTLHIRHHQEFNYGLHGLRTDFIGESGSGKSIVADLLQLIFVGPREYRSATQSLEDKREPKTLLIPGESLGYAFLNIETDEGKYVVVGVQIEDVYHGVRLFIIQQGFEFDEQSRLNPFFEPMKVADIRNGEETLSLAELATHLEQRGYLVKPFPSTKAYHALLYRSELLPIDLASSEQALKTYAKIIQAFSRRKSLDPKKPKELVEFLFGSDKGQENYKQYESLMRAVARDDDDYELNRTEVERIKEKETALTSLRDAQKKFLETKHIYYLALIQNAFEQRRLAKQRLFTAFERYTVSIKSMNHWRNYCQQQHEVFTKQREPLIQAETEALAVYTERKLPFQRAEKVIDWLTHWGGEIHELSVKFNRYKSLAPHTEELRKLLTTLTAKSLLSIFDESDWHLGWHAGEAWTSQQNQLISDEIERSELLQNFTDASNECSLSYWIINYSTFLNKEAVSVLMSLKDTSTRKLLLNDYIPEPYTFFENLPICDQEYNGIWLNLGGLRKFFKYDDEAYKAISDPIRRVAFFTDWHNDVEREIKQLTDRKKKISSLYKTINEFENKADVLVAYKQRADLNQFKTYIPFHISQEEFDACCKCYTDLEVITEAYRIAELSYKSTQIEIQNCNNNLSRLSEQSTDYDELFTPYVITAEAVEQFIREYSDEFVQPFWTAPKTDFSFDANYQMARSAFRSGHSALLPIEDWKTLRQAYNDAQVYYQSTEDKYTAAYKKAPSLPTEKQLGDLGQYGNQYQQAKSDYESEYRQIVKHFLRDSAHELEGNYDYLILVHYLFPNLLGDQSTNEETALALITQRLNEVLGHIKNLNKRRLNQINEVLGEVVEDWRELGRNLRRISRFFEDSKHHITGGHRVKLTPRDSVSFPIEWIHNFRRELATSPEFADQFIDQITFKEKILAAFKTCSMVRNFEPEIRELLNPNSYQDLQFSIVSVDDNETINDGSTGQTYAAIALLCIARLSLIGRGRRKGIRFMPIDEAEGLGSNYDMLYNIVRNNDYQLIAMSINLVGPFVEGDQYVHMLQRDLSSSDPVNYTPYSIFSEPDLDQLIQNDSGEDAQWEDDFDSVDNTKDDSLGDDTNGET